MTASGVYQVIERRGRDAGVEVNPHKFRHTFSHVLKMGRIASDASFGRLREHALPAVQRVALRCGRGAGVPGVCGDLGFYGPSGSGASMMQLISLRGVHHRCAC